jgi:pimeloyl-ACP methyl ester carboxylesterase
MFAQDTAGLIKELAPQGLHVVGHSLGGMVAFQLALDYPELVKTLTIVNSAPAVIFPDLKAHFKFFLRTVNVKLFGMKYLSQMLSHLVFPKPQQLKLREEFIKRWCENDPQAYLNSLKAFKNWNLMNRLGEIKCPTLIISAEHDYTPIEFKEAYAKKIANSKLVVIKDSWHLTIVDQVEIFNATVEKFLKT